MRTPGPTTATSACGYRILEHTADLGISAWGREPRDLFVQAGAALAHILGATAREPTGTSVLLATGTDRAALLVDFLNGLLLLHESEDVALGEIRIQELSDTGLRAAVSTSALDAAFRGSLVKAASYHRLSFIERSDGCEAVVYLDV